MDRDHKSEDFNLDTAQEKPRSIFHEPSLVESITAEANKIYADPKKAAHDVIDVGAKVAHTALTTLHYVWKHPKESMATAKETVTSYVSLGSESLQAGYSAFKKRLQDQPKVDIETQTEEHIESPRPRSYSPVPR